MPRNTKIFCLLFLIATIAAAQTAPVATTFMQVQSTAMIGMTADQTARLNALNLTGTTTPGAPSSCSAQITFLDDQGTVLKAATITVDPGKSLPVDFTPKAGAGRQEIRVTIGIIRPAILTPTAGSGIAMPVYYFCSLVPTLEVMDSTSTKTNFVVSDFHYVYAYPLPLAGAMTGSVPSR